MVDHNVLIEHLATRYPYLNGQGSGNAQSVKVQPADVLRKAGTGGIAVNGTENHAYFRPCN